MDYYVNGRFLTKKLTASSATPRTPQSPRRSSRQRTERWKLDDPGAGECRCECCGPAQHRGARRRPGRGHLWEQMSLPSLAADGVLVNLANSGPIRQPAFLHRDSRCDRLSKARSLLVPLPAASIDRWVMPCRARRAWAPCPTFPAASFPVFLKIKPESIVVIPNARTISANAPDLSVLERFGWSRIASFLFSARPPHIRT